MLQVTPAVQGWRTPAGEPRLSCLPTCLPHLAPLSRPPHGLAAGITHEHRQQKRPGSSVKGAQLRAMQPFSAFTDTPLHAPTKLQPPAEEGEVLSWLTAALSLGSEEGIHVPRPSSGCDPSSQSGFHRPLMVPSPVVCALNVPQRHCYKNWFPGDTAGGAVEEVGPIGGL